MEISIVTPINNLGYGIAGLGILNGLTSLDVKVNLFSIGHKIIVEQEFARNVALALENTKTYDPDADCIRMWHQFDLSLFAGRGKHIGFPIFELDSFNDIELHHLHSCDKIFTCSDWGTRVVSECLYNKYKTINGIYTVPLGVDRTIFYPEKSKRKSTVFLNVGKWETRKGHDVLPTIFNATFSENDDVELWMMCDNPFYNAEQHQYWHDQYKNTKLGHKIKMIPRQESIRQVADLMREADCGIFPTRAEGWNLEALEMLSCGKFVITTNYSGHTEFCSSDNCLLVDIKDTVKAQGVEGMDDKWFFGQGSWAHLDNDILNRFCRHMTTVHELKQGGSLYLNESGIETAKKFSWENSAEKIVNLLL